MPTAEAPPKEAASPSFEARQAAWSLLERAFARRDYEGLYSASEALSRAAFDMGRARKPYLPLLTTPPKKEDGPPEVAASERRYKVDPVASELVTFKKGATLYIVKEGDKGVAVCASEADADLIRRALDAFHP